MLGCEENNEQFYYGGQDDKDPWEAVDVDNDQEEGLKTFVKNVTTEICYPKLFSIKGTLISLFKSNCIRRQPPLHHH